MNAWREAIRAEMQRREFPSLLYFIHWFKAMRCYFPRGWGSGDGRGD